MINSVFISKTLQEVTSLQSFCNEHEITLHAEALIEFEPVPFNQPAIFDVIFFGSKRAVEFYLSNKIDLLDKKVGCVGQQTADKLNSFGIQANFVGEGADVSQIAQEFREWLGDATVLIPQSDRSLQTIQKELNAQKVINLICYKTRMKSSQVPPCDTYVFTSPSNAESFLQSNVFPKGSSIISWGSSTEKFLRERGVKSEQLPAPSVDSLTQYLAELIRE